MKNRIFLFSILAVIAAGPLLFGKEVPEKWGYVPHYGSYSIRQLIRYADDYDIICFTGTFISSKGRVFLKKNPLTSQITDLHRSGKGTFCPLIAFSSPSAGARVLSDTSLLEKAAEAVTDYALRSRFGTIHLDIEYLPPRYSRKIAGFVKEIHSRAGSMRITMALYPPADKKNRYAGSHDIRLLAPFLHRAVLMCYDFHNQNTGPGPVTDLEWAEKNITVLKKYMNRDRIILGIPAYGYIWQDGEKTRALSARYGSRLAVRYGSSRHESGTLQIRGRKKRRFNAHVCDVTCRDMLIRSAQENRIAGWAIWRLGFEDK